MGNNSSNNENSQYTGLDYIYNEYNYNAEDNDNIYNNLLRELKPINYKEKLDNDKITPAQCGAAAISYILNTFGDTVTANYYFPWSINTFNPIELDDVKLHINDDEEKISNEDRSIIVNISNLSKAASLLALAIDKFIKVNDDSIDIEIPEDSIREKINKLKRHLNLISQRIKDSGKINMEIDNVSDTIENVVEENTNIENND